MTTVPSVGPQGRPLIRLAAALLLVTAAGCTTATTGKDGQPIDPLVLAMYAPIQGEPFRIPAVPVSRVDPKYFRQTVATPRHIPNEPGIIVVDPYEKFLYLVQPGGESLRYGIGVGKQGFSWAGVAAIHDKQHWPKWFPPVEMQERDSFAARYPNGMDGGPRNPLGSRALYLYEGKCNENNLRSPDCRDTLYRIHGTFEPLSIGNAVSSGCIRMWHQDVIDLYDRVPLGTKVVVIDGPRQEMLDAPVADMPGVDGDPLAVAFPGTPLGSI